MVMDKKKNKKKIKNILFMFKKANPNVCKIIYGDISLIFPIFIRESVSCFGYFLIIDSSLLI